MVSSNTRDKEWILDSGCTFHMSPNKNWFIGLKETKENNLLMANNDSCEIHGIGSIKLKVHDGSIKTLSNVRYIPNLKRNLISLGVLDDSGFKTKLKMV